MMFIQNVVRHADERKIEENTSQASDCTRN